mmetsp:Transcript_70710/g.167690  ORF Transcript_70710/g.167690 Transcript_70710/m.167690 type:complete len:266 (+) Transcript_70710:2-799(+)|eukprot:CAMPEP_0180147452 /NCGR_PEP_ID=MMETSP0986-20121125/19283_1 /TAXON_ID=697907 /ORGANISM="non described non described, Strain CCMP2293" /LENGTH=265 /DNA_ID=CAMNT_0022093041 /DNA_START=1 /DNA_END=798 /DNA_ORIENTATION=-
MSFPTVNVASAPRAIMLLAAVATQCSAFAPSAAPGAFRAGSAIASKAAVSRAKPALLGLRAAGEDENREKPKTMMQPIADDANFVTKAIYNLEMARIGAMSATPTEENGNWNGEPKEWADGMGLVQQISLVSQVGPFAKFKIWLARSIAGNYDADKINSRIDSVVASAPVAIFSFTTCPFCLKAKTMLAEELGVPASSITVVECDEDVDGNAIRAELGARTGRTSMPSIWIRGEGYVGGCNDGPGVFPLLKDGKLAPMLQAAGAI